MVMVMDLPRALFFVPSFTLGLSIQSRTARSIDVFDGVARAESAAGVGGINWRDLDPLDLLAMSYRRRYSFRCEKYGTQNGTLF